MPTGLGKIVWNPQWYVYKKSSIIGCTNLKTGPKLLIRLYSWFRQAPINTFTSWFMLSYQFGQGFFLTNAWAGWIIRRYSSHVNDVSDCQSDDTICSHPRVCQPSSPHFRFNGNFRKEKSKSDFTTSYSVFWIIYHSIIYELINLNRDKGRK